MNLFRASISWLPAIALSLSLSACVANNDTRSSSVPDSVSSVPSSSAISSSSVNSSIISSSVVSSSSMRSSLPQSSSSVFVSSSTAPSSSSQPSSSSVAGGRIKGFSMGSAHPNDMRKLQNKLPGVDLHIHPYAFFGYGTNNLQLSEISQLMVGRSAWTMETDQVRWDSGYEISYYNGVQNNTSAPCLNVFITIRPTPPTWLSSAWTADPIATAQAIPAELLQKTNITDNRSAAHYYSNQLFTSSWTPYQQNPGMPWGEYLNINGGVTFDMGDSSYWLGNHVPPSLEAVGWTGETWKAHIKSMFNADNGENVIAINFDKSTLLSDTKKAIESMLQYGLKIDYIIIINFSGSEFQGDFIENYQDLANWLAQKK